MNSSNFVLKCKNCQMELIYTLLPDKLFECYSCKHHMSSIYGVWHCNNDCEMDICPLCSLQMKYLCKLCQGQMSFVNKQYINNQNIYQCYECLVEFLMSDGAHFCFGCKKFFCCLECRSKQNDLYNRNSEYYKKNLSFL